MTDPTPAPDVDVEPDAAQPDDEAVLEIEADDQPDAAQPDVPPLPDSPAASDEGAPEVATIPDGPIAEDDRVVPPTVDPSLAPEIDLSSHIYVRAHTNLPGWDLWAEETDPVYADPGNTDSEVMVPAHHREGWIPNNEEGVRAIELGFAEIIEASSDEEPPAKADA